MTVEQALELVRQSSPYVNAQGDMRAAWRRYKAANPGEWYALQAYMQTVSGGGSEEATWRTSWAKGWAGLFTATTAPAPEPAPEPVPVPVKAFLGAMVVTAGNIDPELLRAAGVSKVCVELNDTNRRDFLTSRWNGFDKGWFVVSRGNDGDTLADAVNTHKTVVTHVVVDSESHKTDMGGQLAWTETLYAAFRSKLGPSFPIWNVTFGIHASPQVVNYDAMKRHNVPNIEEAYDANGYSLGVERTVLKAISEGRSPAHVCLGDKSLSNDAGWVKRLIGEGKIGSVWLWSPDQGPAQDALRAGAASLLKAALSA